MSTKTIQYNLEVKNNSKRTFDQVEKDSDKSQKKVGKLAEAMSSIGKDIKVNAIKGAKDQFKGLGDEAKKLYKNNMTLGSIFKDTLGKLINLAFGMLKFRLAMMAAGFILENFGNITNKIGTKFGALGRGFKFLETTARDAWTKIGLSSEKGIESIFKNVPMLRQFSLIFERTLRLFSAGSGNNAQEMLKVWNVKGISPSLHRFAQAAQMVGLKLGTTHGKINKTVDSINVLGVGVGNLGKTFKNIIPSINAFMDKTKYLRGLFGDVAKAGLKFVGLVLKYPAVFGTAIGSLIAFRFALKDILKTTDELDKMGDHAQMVGMSVAAYKAFDNELKKNGTSMSELEPVVATLGAKLIDIVNGTGPAAESFKELNIEVLDINGNFKSNDVILRSIIDRLSKMKDIPLRNAYALEIFGAKGRQIIPILNDGAGALERYNKYVNKHGDAMDIAVIAADRFKDTQQDIKNAFDTAKAILYTGTIQRLAETLQIISNSSIGDVLYVGAVVIFRTLNIILDAVNTILAAFDSLLSGFVYVVTGSLGIIYKSYTDLITWLNNKPLIGKLISDEQVEEYKNKTDAIADYTEKSFNRMIKAGDKSIKSLSNLITLGGTLSEKSTPPGADSGGTPDRSKTGEKPDTSILKKLEDWRIAAIQDSFKREKAQLQRDYNERIEEIRKAETEGVITVKQAAEAKLNIAIWKKSELDKIEQNEHKEYVDNIRKAEEDALNEIQNAFKKEIEIRQRANDLRIQNIRDYRTREKSELEREYEQKIKVNIEDSQSGEVGASEAAAEERLQIDEWYEQQKRNLSIRYTQEYLDRLKSDIDKEKQLRMKQVDEIAKIFGILENGYTNVSNIIKESNNANKEYFEGLNSGLREAQNLFVTISKEIVNLKNQSINSAEFVANTVAAIGQAVNNVITSIVQAGNEARTRSINTWYDNEKKKIDLAIMGHRRRERELIKLEEEKAKKEDEIRRKNFNRQKAASILQAIISGAVAIVMSFAQLGPIVGGIMAALVAGVTAAQIAIIASQKYAKGGIVPGNDKNDNTLARVSSGEMIINKSQQKELFDIANGTRRVRNNNSNPINITIGDTIINGKVDNYTLAKIDEKNYENQRAIQSILKEMQYNGTLKQFAGAF